MKRSEDIRKILADNLKENRRKQGITQEQFAEKADVSTHYVAMIETCKAFPTADMLERLAKTLNIAPYQLFSVDAAPNEVFEQMRQVIIADIKQLMPDMEQVMMGIKQGVKEAVKETLAEDSNGKSC